MRSLASYFTRALLTVAVCWSAPASAAVEAVSGAIRVSVDETGWFEVMTHSPAWKFSGSVGAPLTGLAASAGRDIAGAYREIAFQYSTSGVGARRGAIRVYRNRPVVTFLLAFLTAGNAGETFPAISSYPAHLHHLSYTGVFGGFSFERFGTDGPWVFFDDQANAFILSPASHFMNAVMTLGPRNELLSSVAASNGQIPSGFVATTALVVERGINRAFESWGRFLTDRAGKMRPTNDADLGLRSLGYWTDNGAQYYYYFEEALGYTGTLLEVRNEFSRMGIPLGYLQLDSWFYGKGQNDSWQGSGPLRGGTYLYEASKELFPDGLADFHTKLGVPLIAHNRWIDEHSPYRKTHSISGNVLTDPGLWGAWMGYLRAAGVRTYEQDWLSGPAIPERDLSSGEQFMDAMANAARNAGLTLQYCMPLPRHFLQGTRYPNLTTIRVSGDRFRREQWPAFLFNGRLASALGEWPWSDVFMSSETSNLLLATLSASIVGIGDGIGRFDRSNLLRAVRADGVIVKPDDAIAPLDVSYIAQANGRPSPIIAAAHTKHNAGPTSYVFAFATPQSDPPRQASSLSLSRQQKRDDQGDTAASFSPAELGYGGPVYAYNAFEGWGRYLQLPPDALTFTAPDQGAYWIVVPVGASGVGFLGDEGKFVSNGRKRIARIRDNGILRARIIFAKGESRMRLHGFSLARPQVRAAGAAVEHLAYDTRTRLFHFDLISRTGASPLVTIRSAGYRER
jgi:hypothetical protein